MGSTNGGTSLPGNKETERTTAPGSDNASGSKSSSDYKYMRKKVLAKHWEEANSTSTTSSDKVRFANMFNFCQLITSRTKTT